MDSDDEYENGTDTLAHMEHGYAIGAYEEEDERFNPSYSSENGDGFDDPPVLSPPHTMDISSVRRPPVPEYPPTTCHSPHFSRW